MPRRFSALTLCLCLVTVEAGAGDVAVLPAQEAVELPAIGRVVEFSGPVVEGDYRHFVSVTAAARPDLVVLDSPGGIISEALRIAERIRADGYATHVRGNGQCASACMVMFLSGRPKSVEPGARLGLHAARHEETDESVSVPGTAAMAAIFGQLGVPIDIVVQMAEVRPSDMWWLTKEQQLALGIEFFESTAPSALDQPIPVWHSSEPLSPDFKLRGWKDEFPRRKGLPRK